MPVEWLTAAETALDGVRQGLAADGYVLECRGEEPATLVVRIAATPEACEDCLSPKSVMQMIIGAALAQSGLGETVRQVEVFYPKDGPESNGAGAAAAAAALQAARHAVAGEAEAVELCYERGWTDGLPVIPPTPERVAAMLAAGGVAAATVLGRIPERNVTIHAEHLAINAVMAGCLPAYMPVLLAAARGLLDPAFGLHGPTASTAGVGLLTIVHGPVARAIGVNSGESVFGPGHRANATIGRALRLLVLNSGGRQFDRATLGHPGKYTYCIAEQEEAGWEPLHLMRGLNAADSAVTVFAAEAPNQVSDHVSAGAEALLHTFARRMAAPGSMNAERGRVQMAVVFCPEHRRTLQAAGWSKAAVQRWLWENARPENASGRVAPAPDDILILTAGGEAGRFSAILPGWGSKDQCAAVTVPVSFTGGE